MYFVLEKGLTQESCVGPPTAENYTSLSVVALRGRNNTHAGRLSGTC